MCLLSFFSLHSFAAAGIVLNGGYCAGSSNFDNVEPPDLNTGMGGYSGSSSAGASGGNSAFQITAFYEQPELFKLSEKSIFGVFAGYETFAGNDFSYGLRSLPYYDFELGIKVDGYRIPFGAYYKYKTSDKFALKCGLGATYVKSSWKRELSDYDGNNSKNDETSLNALMPRIDAGFEWLITKVFTIGMDFSYTVNGKIENPYETPGQNTTYYTDYTGFSASLALRFYVLS